MKNKKLAALLVFSFIFIGCLMNANEEEFIQSTQSTNFEEEQETPIPETYFEEEPEEGEQEQETIFEGGWITNIKNNAFATLEFTNNNFVYVSNDSMGMYYRSGSYSGTFTFTENILTLTTPDIVFTMIYNFRNNGSLLLENLGGNVLLNSGFEILTKQ
jgi:hypothetical protein